MFSLLSILGFLFFFFLHLPLSVSPCSHFVVQINLQCHFLYLCIILSILLPSAFVFPLLCLHLFFLSVFSSLPSLFHCWVSSCSYSIFVLRFSLLPLFLPCASDFFLLALCKRDGSQSCSLVDWLVVRIPVSFLSLPAGTKRRDVEVDTLQF